MVAARDLGGGTRDLSNDGKVLIFFLKEAGAKMEKAPFQSCNDK
uniref:Uncharacterized protein n=1 Tax=Arundo donax TaxID=35708 RepID=A0A0A8Z7H1_ARUDO